MWPRLVEEKEEEEEEAEEEGEEDVHNAEMILDHRRRPKGRSYEYLVKWEGYPDAGEGCI